MKLTTLGTIEHLLVGEGLVTFLGSERGLKEDLWYTMDDRECDKIATL